MSAFGPEDGVYPLHLDESANHSSPKPRSGCQQRSSRGSCGSYSTPSQQSHENGPSFNSTRADVTGPTTTKAEKTTIEINKARVLSFFSDTRDIREFLGQFSVHFALVNKAKQTVTDADCLLLKKHRIYSEDDLRASKHHRIIHLYAPELHIMNLHV
jgi:hypothetical protein